MLVMDAIAVYRLTRLATEDSITQPLRERIIRWCYYRVDRNVDVHAAMVADGMFDDPDKYQRFADHDPKVPKLAELVTCRWCAGMWLAGAVVVLRRFRFWHHVRDALAFSAAAALLARLED